MAITKSSVAELQQATDILNIQEKLKFIFAGAAGYTYDEKAEDIVSQLDAFGLQRFLGGVEESFPLRRDQKTGYVHALQPVRLGIMRSMKDFAGYIYRELNGPKK